MKGPRIRPDGRRGCSRALIREYLSRPGAEGSQAAFARALLGE